MFKITLTAGHYRYQAGRRCLKKYDPNETREWILNARVCDKVAKLLESYEGYSLIRTDDVTGEKEISLADRVKKANNFGADIYISIHHNAGIYGGKGGGVTAYVYNKTKKQASLDWQKALYDNIIKHTGLKGNRATPLAKANFQELRETTMPAVLLECGFMDSQTDIPIIITEDFTNKVAKAIVEVIVEKGKLTKKPVDDGKIYRVQVGAYKDRANAEKTLAKLKADGYDAIIV